jgi:serine/threonine-protein kinase ATR
LQIEAAWTLSDWEEVAEVASSGAVGPNISIGKVLLAMHNREQEALDGILTTTRRELGLTVTANHRQYARAYEAALHLHMLHEIELIRNSGLSMAQRTGNNRDILIKHDMDVLRASLGNRLGTTMPSYRVREPILGMRRTAFGLR